MKNFKMILADIDVKETLKFEIDDIQIILITLKNEHSIEDILRKYKEKQSVDLYMSGNNFKDDYIQRKKLVDIKDIEIIAFSLEENSFMIKFYDYEYVDISQIRKDKIKTMLNT